VFMWVDKLDSLDQSDVVKHVKNLCLKYPNEFEVESFSNEVQALKFSVALFLPESIEIRNSGSIDILNVLYKEDLVSAFPNVHIALRICLTLPTTVASNERGFSKLKLINSYLRSSSGQN